MFEKEWFPKANAIGVSWNDFWKMNPHIIKLLMDGYMERMKQQDYINWLNGQYTLSAVVVAVANCFSKKSNAKYIEKPILQEMEEKSRTLSEEELQRQRELFVAKLELMKTNFEISHQDSTVS